jgi:ketosteroid isomerase-like protein
VSDSAATRTPRETAELLLHTIVHGRRTDIADLYAEDVRIENPWAPDGVPGEAAGRENLRARMMQTEELWSFDSVRDVLLHETADPQVIVLEYRVDASIRASGAEFSLGFVTILRILDGLIVSSRDYSNPLETAEVAKLISFEA